MRRLLLAPAIFACLMVACGGGGGPNKYPDTVVQNFMNSCKSSARSVANGEQYCACSLKEVQKKYTLKEFTALEITMSSTGQIPLELTKVISKCLK